MERNIKCNRVLKDSKSNTVRDEHGNAILLPEREVSLDKLIAEDWDYPSTEPSPENEVIGQIEIEMLYHSLDSLDADERALINALFFDDMTEREYAQTIGISKTALHARKIKVLGKLKNILQK